MKTEDIKNLLEKYYNGESSLEEEAQIRAFFKGETPPELAEDKQLFAMFAASEDEKSERIFVPSADRIDETANRRKGRTFQIYAPVGIAAAVSLTFFGLAAGLFIGGKTNSREISDMRRDIREMKEMATISQLNNESASERILAAYEIKKMPEADEETLNALINTLLVDDNANVRLAAADALFKFGDHSKVRKALIDALNKDEDPNVQIRLIDMLVKLKEKRALPGLQQMMENESKMPVVRERAALGMGQLL